MPYYSTKDLPQIVKDAIPSEKGRQIVLDAFMSSYNKDGDDVKAIRVAWTVLKKRGYKKNNKGQWVKGK